MKRILLASLLLLIGCDPSNEYHSKPTSYSYGLVASVKDGFYKGYGCVILHDYIDTIYCRIAITPDGEMVKQEYQVKVNLEKSNVTIPAL